MSAKYEEAVAQVDAVRKAVRSSVSEVRIRADFDIRVRSFS